MIYVAFVVGFFSGALCALGCLAYAVVRSERIEGKEP